MLTGSPTRRVQRVRHELRLRNVQVLHVRRLGPGFAAITFGGDELHDFVSPGFDDHLKFMVGDARGEPVRRDYTPRRFDAAARELTIEFALHGHGLASTWARNAVPGARATLGGPRGSMVVPTDLDWHLLVGDATALPAIHRRLEELPAGTRALVVVQVADMADRRALTSAADLSLQWVDSEAALLGAVRGLTLPPGEGHAWAAGEHAAMAAVRRELVETHGLPREAMRVAAYWKRGAASHHEELAD